MSEPSEGKRPVGYEILDNGFLCAIMPTEADVDAETWVFMPKVRIVGNLETPNNDGFLMPKSDPKVDE